MTVGAATGGTVAKIAAEQAKPDGMLPVLPGEEARFLAPLSVEVLTGIGPRASRQLRSIGILTLGQLGEARLSILRRVFGRRTELGRELARGRDDCPVGLLKGTPRSVGHEKTFPVDERGRTALRRAIAALAEEPARSLRARDLQGRVVTVKVRFADFGTVTRQRVLPRPSADGAVIGEVAKDLLNRILLGGCEPVRRLGVRVSVLSERAVQLPLFTTRVDDLLRGQRVLRLLDELAWRDLPVRPGWVLRTSD